MPNGEGHDPRALWEKVRDMQSALSKEREKNKILRDLIEELDKEVEALTFALKKVQDG